MVLLHWELLRILQVLLQAVLWRAHVVVKALIEAGAPVDWLTSVGGGLIMAVVEEASKEVAGLGIIVSSLSFGFAANLVQKRFLM